MHELIGHKLTPGREIMHIERIFDHGVSTDLNGHHYGAFFHSVICGGMRRGLSRHGSMGNVLASVEATHAQFVKSDSNGHPFLDPEKVGRYRACTTCFSVYNSESS